MAAHGNICTWSDEDAKRLDFLRRKSETDDWCEVDSLPVSNASLAGANSTGERGFPAFNPLPPRLEETEQDEMANLEEKYAQHKRQERFLQTLDESQVDAVDVTAALQGAGAALQHGLKAGWFFTSLTATVVGSIGNKLGVVQFRHWDVIVDSDRERGRGALILGALPVVAAPLDHIHKLLSQCETSHHAPLGLVVSCMHRDEMDGFGILSSFATHARWYEAFGVHSPPARPANENGGSFRCTMFEIEDCTARGATMEKMIEIVNTPNVLRMVALRVLQGDRGLYYCANYTTPANGHDLSLLSGFVVAAAVVEKLDPRADSAVTKQSSGVLDALFCNARDSSAAALVRRDFALLQGIMGM